MLSLVDLDSKRIAIVLRCDGQTVVVTGVGVSTSDPTVGSVLQVQPDEEFRSQGNPVFVFPESDIEVRRQSCHGCEFCVTIGWA